MLKQPIRLTAAAARRALRAHASAAGALGAAQFFKTGPGQYGEGDRFIGVAMPQLRQVARRFRALAQPQPERLLISAIHEERALALAILVQQFAAARARREQQRLVQLYLRRRRYVNNWDLVDGGAEYILGAYLAGQRDRSLLDRLARSKHLWSRRIAMVPTLHFIRRGDAADALRIAAQLLDDEHNLIHKATGWMLREIGKRVAVAPLRVFPASPWRAPAAHRAALCHRALGAG